MSTPFRIRVEYDPEARFEECNGEPRPLTEEEYAENQYMNDGVPIPYAEYLRYYGNPDRHVYLSVFLQRRCAACEQWHETGESLHNIDLMDDDPGADEAGKVIEEAEWHKIGYLREVARELKAEYQSQVLAHPGADPTKPYTRRITLRDPQELGARGRNSWFAPVHLVIMRTPLLDTPKPEQSPAPQMLDLRVYSRREGRDAPIVLQLSPFDALALARELMDLAAPCTAMRHSVDMDRLAVELEA